LLGGILSRVGLHACLTAEPEHALNLFRQRSFDVFFAELESPAGIAVLAEARHLQPALWAIMVAHQPSAEACVEAMRLGARDCVFKPLTTEKVLAALRRVTRLPVALPELGWTPESPKASIGTDAAPSGQSLSLPLVGGLKEIEARLVHEVIRRFDGNKTAAAKALGMHRRTLYRFLSREPRSTE
jgi:two-component system response regulator RegA